MPIFLEQFKNFSQEINDRLANPHSTLATQTRDDIIAKYTEMESYFNVVQQILASKQPFEDTGLTIDEIQIKFETFKQTVNQLFLTKVEPPKVVVPEQKPDADMKEEVPK